VLAVRAGGEVIMARNGKRKGYRLRSISPALATAQTFLPPEWRCPKCRRSLHRRDLDDGRVVQYCDCGFTRQDRPRGE
jgi:hypothetical protein